MRYLYSSKNNAFYDADDLEQKEAIYQENGIYPTDAKEVTAEMFSEFACNLPPTGKVRGSDKNGNPAWVKAPEPTHEEQVAYAESVKSGLLAMAGEKTRSWQTQLALDIITDSDKKQLIQWMKYVQVVNATDTSSAPDIEWPAQPN